MQTDELLKRATARPWLLGNDWRGVSLVNRPGGFKTGYDADDIKPVARFYQEEARELAQLAVNTFEAARRDLRTLTSAAERVWGGEADALICLRQAELAARATLAEMDGPPDACEKCGHSCPDDSLCDKCGSDPIGPQDRLCAECDSLAAMDRDA